jgi:hypothetical protein
MSDQVEPVERRLRRAEAAKYVVAKFNVPCSPKTLANLACSSSEGPPFILAGRYPLYAPSDLDTWALAKFGLLVRSTAEAQGWNKYPLVRSPAEAQVEYPK